MSCELYKSEMFAWRADSDAASFQPLFDHLTICPECARRFEQVTASDQILQRTFRCFPERPGLEAKIFAGLAHQRAQEAARGPIWKSWIFIPVFASLLIVFLWGIRPQLQQMRLNREVAALMTTPPALQIDSSDRHRLCVEGWSAIAWWCGLRFDDLLCAYPPMSQAKWVRVESSVNLDPPGNSDPYFVSLDLPTARHPQTLLATHFNGQPLTVDHGAPLRLLVPIKLGLKNVKAITKLSFVAEEPSDYRAERGYSRYDGI